jgi:hypothetical protein
MGMFARQAPRADDAFVDATNESDRVRFPINQTLREETDRPLGFELLNMPGERRFIEGST